MIQIQDHLIEGQKEYIRNLGLSDLFAPLTSEERERKTYLNNELEKNIMKLHSDFRETQDKDKELQILNEICGLFENHSRQAAEIDRKVQERQLTKSVEDVGIKQVLHDRIKADEKGLERVTKRHENSEAGYLSEHGLKIATDGYKTRLRKCQAALDKYKQIEKSGSDQSDFSEVFNILNETNALLEIPKTRSPHELVAINDKVTNRLFTGGFTDRRTHNLKMEKDGAREQLTAAVTTNFEGLEGVQVSRELTLYDKQVYNSIVSLYVDGKNEYITPLMIYRTMTGNARAGLSKNILESILESVTKFSLTQITIDAEQEAKAYGMDKLIYKGNLIYIERVTGIHNGQVGEWIRILKKPVLYDYASNKNHIARIDLELLNTPLKKTKEVIIQQTYLLGRILAMRGSNQSRNILYSTVYQQLDIEAESPGALRNKQQKIRDNTKQILDHWKAEGFIKDFKENTGKWNSKISVTIEI